MEEEDQVNDNAWGGGEDEPIEDNQNEGNTLYRQA